MKHKEKAAQREKETTNREQNKINNNKNNNIKYTTASAICSHFQPKNLDYLI